jgi:hypothetical protein
MVPLQAELVRELVQFPQLKLRRAFAGRPREASIGGGLPVYPHPLALGVMSAGPCPWLGRVGPFTALAWLLPRPPPAAASAGPCMRATAAAGIAVRLGARAARALAGALVLPETLAPRALFPPPVVRMLHRLRGRRAADGPVQPPDNLPPEAAECIASHLIGYLGRMQPHLGLQVQSSELIEMIDVAPRPPKTSFLLLAQDRDKVGIAGVGLRTDPPAHLRQRHRVPLINGSPPSRNRYTQHTLA